MPFPRPLNRALITWFGCGRVPVAPGTAGSLGALPLCWVLSEHTSLLVRIVFAVGFTCIAILAAAEDQREASQKDPGYVVIDEVAGMLWATLLLPAAWLPFLCAFILFRVLDVVKPFPANLFDRASKSSAHWFRRGMNIILDDVIAGLYCMLILQGLILYVFPK